MTERPTKEQIERWRALARTGLPPGVYEPLAETGVWREAAVSLLAEVDALRREQKVERKDREALGRAIAVAYTALWRARFDKDPTPEQLAKAAEDLRHCAVNAACSLSGHKKQHPKLVARADAADQERDAAIARAVAAEQRAETVELALRDLHAKAAEVTHSCPPYDQYDDAEGVAAGRDAMAALRGCLAATPTDLAEALRRELRAEGMELALAELRESSKSSEVADEQRT